MEVIKTEGLTKYYGKVTGVRDLNLSIHSGEIFGFLGPNGAGKTTTMRLLVGLLRPSAGKAYVLGKDSWSKRVEIARDTGYLPGETRLYARLTGIEHINFVAGFGHADRSFALKLASRFELDLNRRTEEYSRGMKQQLALILALMKRPRILIMDEPTSGLDPLMQYLLYEILNDFRDNGTTIMLSSHNLPEVERVCNRVGIIKDGSLVAVESIEDLRNKRIRNIEVTFENGIPPQLETIAGIIEIEMSANRARIKTSGNLNPLIALLSKHRISDLSISHASLEDVFIEFYEKGRDEPYV